MKARDAAGIGELTEIAPDGLYGDTELFRERPDSHEAALANQFFDARVPRGTAARTRRVLVRVQSSSPLARCGAVSESDHSERASPQVRALVGNHFETRTQT